MRLIPHPLPRLTAAALALFVLAGCADRTPLSPVTPTPEPPAPAHALGVVEITLSGLAEGATPSANVLSARSASELAVLRSSGTPGGRGTSFALTPPTLGSGSQDGSIQLEPLASGSFTQGTRGQGGVRYLWATYRVRNAQADGTAYTTARQNLSFVAVATGSTLAGSAVSRLKRFDGSNAAAAIAATLTPTGAVQKNPATGAITSASPDVLQLFSEAEAAAMPRDGGITDVFPYGFVVRNAGTGSRTLPANPGAEQWDGIVTFAFQLPLQATAADDPFSISIQFQALDDSDTRITESLEEQTFGGAAAFAARASALGATATLLPGSSYTGGQPARMLCGVRTAGTSASPVQVLGPCSDLIRKETITTGEAHSCGLSVGGVAYCWGWNSDGQLGDGTTADRSTPVAVNTTQRFTSISAGSFHTVALTSDGRAYAWGYVPLVGGKITTPISTITSLRFVSIAAGGYHTVALTADGTAYAWGVNSSGQLGDGTYTPSYTPVAVSTTKHFVSISAGDVHTVALTTDGTAYAWGDNADGQLGDGTSVQRNAPVAVATDKRFVSIATSYRYTAALSVGGAAYAWGENGSGQLGDGTTTRRYAPVAVATDKRFLRISAGRVHTVALTTDGAAYAWGDNNYFQLGDGTRTIRNTPVAVATDTRFVSISAGGLHTVALTSDGSAYSWGNNDFGQLGDGTNGAHNAPATVSGGLTFLRP